MNPFDPYVDGEVEATAGPPRGFFDSAEAAFQQAYRVDSTLGLEAEIQSRWENTVRAYERKTGQATNLQHSYEVTNALLQPMLPANVSRLGADLFTQGIGDFGRGEAPGTPGFRVAQEREAQVKQARELSEHIKQLNDPDLQSLEQIFEDVKIARGEIIAEANEAGFWGSLFGGIGGTVAGIATGRDPVNLIGMIAGGAGKTAARRIGTEMVANAGAEFAAQELSIQPTRVALGEPEGGVGESVLYAALFGGAFRGAIEGGGALLRRTPEVEDAALREVFDAAPQNPQARAGRSLLDEADSFDNYNPHGDTEVGKRVFTAELAEVQALLAGRTDTAIARALPQQEFNLEVLDLDTQVVREQQPLVFERTVQTQQALAAVDAEIVSATQAVDTIGLVEAVARIDEDAAELIRSFEGDLASPQLTRAQREAVTSKINTVVESLGVDSVRKELNDAQIGPRKELQRLRKERQAAAKRYSLARNELDKAVKQVQLEREIKQRVLGAGQTIPRNKADVFPEREAQVAQAAETLNDYSATLIPEQITADGIDLGDGVLLPTDFKITDPDNPAKEVTFGDLMRRIREDEQMLEAIRTCAV